MSNVAINISAEYTGKNAFRQATKNVQTLERTVKRFASGLGVGLGLTAVTAFGKAAVKAFAADEKAAVRLAKVVDNLGLSFANPQLNNYIESLTLASGVSDDKLRPALQALLQTTGSVTNSQKLLAQAIDISAGSGFDLTQTANDLAQAYVGNTRGLRKYNLGLTKAELAAASFEKIQRLLNKQFSGSQAAYLETYAGKMEKFSNAANEAKEIIGKGLLDALSILGGEGVNDIDAATSSMQKLATATSEAMVGQATFWSMIGSTKGGGILKSIANGAGAYFAEIFGITASRELGRMTLNPATGASTIENYNMTSNAKKITDAKAKAERDALKRAKEILAAQRKATEEARKQAALKKLSKVFDIEQANLIAALKGNLSEDERRRAEAQLAILNGNEKVAADLTKQILMSQDATGGLYKLWQNIPDAKNPFGYLDAWIKQFQEKLDALKFPQAVAVATSTLPPIAQSDVNRILEPSNPKGISTVRDYFESIGMSSNAAPVPTAASKVGTGQGSSVLDNYLNVVVQLDGKTIAQSMQNQSLSGTPTGVNRSSGMFGG